MPANFKKRMLSDYTGSQTVTENDRINKRLRIAVAIPVSSANRSTLILDTNDITSPSAAHAAITDLRQQIEVLSDNGVNVAVADLLAASSTLSHLFHLFPNDASLQSYIIQTLGLLLALPLGTACLSSLRSFFLSILHDSPCLTVRLDLLRTLLHAGTLHSSSNKAFVWHITALVEKSLATMRETSLVAAALDLIGHLFPFTDTSRKFVLRLWTLYRTNDANDVRAAAYRMLNRLVSRGFSLDVNMYKRLCMGLEDVCGSVRGCAMDLIFRLSQRHPNHQVVNQQADDKSTINLVDDVFCRICDRVNDWLIELRAQAATLLGKMEGVGMSYVLQTVDKKLMSDLRVKVAGHERQKQLYESGEWSSGRKWADDAPKEKLQQDAVTLMAIGATGAFVLALEDEFEQVRQPAVVSMAQLAAKHPAFGQTCAEFLVDMFNDEIHAVRLAALHSFPLLGSGVELREDQLEMVLSVLQDASLDIRQGLRAILPTFRYSSSKLIRSVHTALMTNIRQYPGDHGQISACLAQLGAANGALIQPDVPTYLALHPYLHSTEPKADDRNYMATMALVCNAAVQAPKVFDLFLDFHRRHYLLYRYKYPEWFPVLERVDKKSVTHKEGSSKEGLVYLLASMRQSILKSKDLSQVIQLTELGRHKVQEECAGDRQMITTATWLQLQLDFLGRMAHELAGLQHTDLSAEQDLRTVVDQLRGRFSYHAPPDLANILTLSLLDKLIQIVKKGGESDDWVEVGGGLESEGKELREYLVSSGETVPEWVTEACVEGRVERARLVGWLRNNLAVPRLPTAGLRCIHTQIISPPPYNEYPVTILAGTIHKIAFEAVVKQCPPDHLLEMGVMVVMGDEKRVLVNMKRGDYVVEESGNVVISKDISISQPVWTDVAGLQLQLVRIINTSAESSTLEPGILTGQLLEDDHLSKLLFLGTPVTYRIKTVPVRSNI